MIENKLYKNIKEYLRKLNPFKSVNSKYRDQPKDVDAERHPEEQMYPDLLKKKKTIQKNDPKYCH